MGDEIKDCRMCRFGGPAMNDASGAPIGSRGCGCSQMSQPSGRRYVMCAIRQAPVVSTKAERCPKYESSPDPKTGAT